MIPQLASPSVCVIDDEEPDYRPILNALLRLGIGCVHVKGDIENLPPQPFKGLRIVFTDLHLSTFVGKDAASHTANIFKTVVSSETAPVVVVIWSKYADDVPENTEDLPPDDQPTEADLFKQALLTEVPQFEGRLVFLQMPKPKRSERPDIETWENSWIASLQEEIKEVLKGIDAFDVLWTWEALIRDIGIEVSRSLTDLACSMTPIASSPPLSLNDRLKLLLKLLAQQQGGPDCSESTAPRHLLTVLSQLGQEKLEVVAPESQLGLHGNWLTERLDKETRKKFRSSQLNSLILTTTVASSFAPFLPGTVYKITDRDRFTEVSGYSVESLQQDCFIEGDLSKKIDARKDFQQRTKPVLLEISPQCDFHQGNRRSAILLAGIICPQELLRNAKLKDACIVTPVIEDSSTSPVVEVGLVFCSRYRLTVNHGTHPDWVRPWLRLRDSLTTEIRNWHASQAARVGYLSF